MHILPARPASCLLPVLFLAASFASGAARADMLYGVIDGPSTLVSIDPTTGKGTIIGGGDPSYSGPEDIEIDGQGRLISVGFYAGLNGLQNFKTTFVQVDPQTGAVTPLATAANYSFFEGLANVNGVLYGSASAADSYGVDTSNHLVRIDLNAKTFTEVGTFGPAFQNVEDIAYSPKYGLIGVDIGTLDPMTNFQTYHTTPALIHIDINTGAATKIADLPFTNQLVSFNGSTPSPFGPYLCGLDFAPDGTLYATTFPTHFGGDSHLVTVDPVTGAITDIGDIGINSVDGIKFIQTVPEPSSLASLLVGSLLLAGIVRRRRAGSSGLARSG